MYSKTTEDLDGSNEDLIGPQRMSDDTFGYAQLQLGGDDSNTGHPPYAVVVNNSPTKSRRKNRQILFVFLFIALALLCVVFISLYASKKSEIESLRKASQKERVCVSPGCVAAANFMEAAIDRSANPCDNFYQYACGGWIEKNPIPEEQSRLGVDSVLANRNMYVLRHILEGHGKGKTQIKDSKDAEQKARNFYKACMQTEAIKKAGKQPLIDLLKSFHDAVDASLNRNTAKLLTEKMVVLNRNYSISALFATYVEVDARNSSQNAIQVTQAGLFLSQTRYDANMTDKTLSAYVKYMIDIHTLLGAKDRSSTEALVTDILNFEKKLAKIFVPRENMTEMNQTYNKMKIGELQVLCPVIDWLYFYKKVFGSQTKITAEQELIVFAKPYLQKLNSLVANATPKMLFGYIQWRLIATFLPHLTDEFRAARKDLEIALYGTHISQPRWKTCVRQTDSAIGFAMGSLFVKKRFPGNSKKVAKEMVEQLRAAFIESLPSVEWMDDATRKAAKEKALAVFPKIGYPEIIMDPKKLNARYKDVMFGDTDYFQNILAERAWSSAENTKELHKPVDKKAWYMTPATVNAYYDATRNQIVFPAGILQPPYYDTRYPMAINYGGIGAVIGHELLHGFDNQGRLFDKFGNSGKLWWTKHAVDEFKKKEKCFINEYSGYTIKGKHINGKVTLGENIADNGGLKAAFNAYKSWTRKNGEEPAIPGIKITNDQAFFVSFAQSWCTSARTAAIWEQLNSDSHSPAMDRVLGSISNSYEFANAFKCPAGATYNPNLKCKIW